MGNATTDSGRRWPVAGRRRHQSSPMIQSCCFTFGHSGVAPPLRYPRAWRAVLRRRPGNAMMANEESSASMDARIILVEGFPGCGKSTTAQWLARQLRTAGRPAEWFYEQQRPHPMAGETPTGNVAVGTVKKSKAIRSLAWFFKNVRHACDGGLRCRTMYFETVACETVRPSFSSSPWIFLVHPREDWRSSSAESDRAARF